MLKNQIRRIVMVVGSLLILLGVALMLWMLSTEDERNVIKLDLGVTESIEFKDLDLIPGEKCEYTVKLENSGVDKYGLRLKFVETEEKTLKYYARVKILSGGETVCDELLADIFTDKEIVLPVDFKQNKNTELTIVYYLPLDVGNEAKNAEAKFELQLTATSE